MNDLGKQCPHCMGLIGYTHRPGCPVALAERYAPTFIDQIIADVDAVVQFHRPTAAQRISWKTSREQAQVWNDMTPEQRFTESLSAYDQALLKGMRITWKEQR